MIASAAVSRPDAFSRPDAEVSIGGGTGGSGDSGDAAAIADPIGDRDPSQPPEEAPKPTGFWTWQPDAERLYGDTRVQVFVAFLICVNFMTNIVEKQIDPERKFWENEWEKIDMFYNIIFTFELLLNMYGRWCCKFWKSGWNIFDFIVVAVGLIHMTPIPLPEPFKLLRMMRAFRVFRLFKKIESINKIVVSLVHAVPGMMNAFLITLLFMCIYAVLAVDFFGHAEKIVLDCEQEPEPTLTARKKCHGEEYYSTFAKSLYTLFQVLTGDSWSEAVVRPIFDFFEAPLDQFLTGMFFVTFILINSFTLINVVVAVLLDKMSPVEEEQIRPEQDIVAGVPVVANAALIKEAKLGDLDDCSELAEVATLKTEMTVMSDSWEKHQKRLDYSMEALYGQFDRVLVHVDALLDCTGQLPSSTGSNVADKERSTEDAVRCDPAEALLRLTLWSRSGGIGSAIDEFMKRRRKKIGGK